jgi:hypothetical protein
LGLVATQLFTSVNPLKHEAPSKPVTLNPIPSVPGKLGEAIRRLLQQMLVVETDARPSASDMLRQFQELYLAQHKREMASEGKGLVASSEQSSPTIAKSIPAAKHSVPAEKSPKPTKHPFGYGIFDDENHPK